jgi:hypothetical protein
MKLAIIVVVGTLVLVVGVVVLLGSLLPRNHRATRLAVFKASPDAVFSVISDFQGTASWRTGIKEIEMVSTQQPVRFRERGSNGTILYQVDACEPSRRIVTRIADDSLPFSGTWTQVLTARGDGTELSVTEDGAVRNPVFRFMSHYFFSPTKTMDIYLRDLGVRLGEVAHIQI